MLIRRSGGWEIPERHATPESAYRAFVGSRRRFLGALAGAGAAAVIGCRPEPDPRALEERLGPFPPTLDATRNPAFTIDGAPTERAPTMRYNNFYEMTMDKEVWRHVGRFETRPWTVEVTGLVQKPRVWDLDEILALPLEERLYRHRCVEAWFMDVPWIGVPLRQLIEPSLPLSRARHVRFESVLRPEQLPGQAGSHYKWPYYEGLTLAEAMNELTLATVGIYGAELPKQNGAPLRVVVPWKYGYKGPKSVVRIELVAEQPRTFWNDLHPLEYSFLSNVNPDVPHPRWSQARERSIDGSGSRATKLYNGYAEWVGHLYG